VQLGRPVALARLARLGLPAHVRPARGPREVGAAQAEHLRARPTKRVEVPAGARVSFDALEAGDTVEGLFDFVLGEEGICMITLEVMASVGK
jgi:hypothetical protein